MKRRNCGRGGLQSKATMGNVKQLKYGALNKTSQMDM